MEEEKKESAAKGAKKRKNPSLGEGISRRRRKENVGIHPREKESAARGAKKRKNTSPGEGNGKLKLGCTHYVV